MMKRILYVLLSLSLLAGAACEKKAEKDDQDPAAAAQEAKKEEEKKAEKAEQPEEPEVPEAVTEIDCSAKPEAEGLEVSDKSEEGAKTEGDEESEELPADSPLLNPEKADAKAPSEFWAKFNTTEGPIVIRFEREWSPRGVDRVYNLIKMGYYEDIAFFRVIDGFMAQFGIHGNPAVNAVWNPNPKDMPKEEYEKKNAAATIEDDPVKESNTRGKVTFAKKGIPNSRTVQLFINYADNKRLDQSGFAPIGEVAKCMDNVDALHAGYGEGAPRGQGPSQQKLNEQGNEYLQQQFPELDYIETTEIIAER